MAKSNGRGNIFLWVGGAALLTVAALFFLPKFMGKPAVAPVPVPAAVVTQKPAQNFAVANAQYGYVPDMNFAGLAIEGPTNAMPLGFHLNNIV